MESYVSDIRVLSGEEVLSLLNVKLVLDAVEHAFIEIGNGNVTMPQKEPMYLDEKHSFLIAMPTVMHSDGVAGVKFASAFFKPRPNLPSVAGALIILNDATNGQPLAIMDAVHITNWRTAGGHAVIAAKYLAKKDSKVLTIVGCGEEGRTGIRGFLEAFDLKQIRLCDIRKEAMQAVADEFAGKAEFVFCENTREGVAGADIVQVATTANVPLVQFEDLPKGCCVVGMQSFHDLDHTCSHKADKWVLGNRKSDGGLILNNAELREFLSESDVYADLAEVVSGKVPGRESDDEIIVYTHLGMGSLDISVAKVVYDLAVEKGMGTMIRI